MNPAERLLPFVVAAQRLKGAENMPTRTVWISIFEKLQINLGESGEDLTRNLLALRVQVEIAAEELQDEDVPESLYAESLARLSDALNPDIAGNNWKSTRESMDVGTAAVLMWSSWTIGTRELAISQEERDELLARIDELDGAVASEGVPTTLRRAIRRQTAGIRSALNDYVITGAAPLRSAVASTLANVAAEAPTYVAAASGAPVERKVVATLYAVLTSGVSVIDKSAMTVDRFKALLVSTKDIWKLLTPP